MKHFLLFIFVGLSAFGYCLDSADRSAMESIIQGYTDSWNMHQGKGFADNCSEDADWVNIFGMHFSGRVEIEERHRRILTTFYKDSILKITDQSFREVQPGLVIAIVRWKLDGYRDPGPDNTKPGTTREGIFTHVFINKDNKWEMTASHNTIKP